MKVKRYELLQFKLMVIVTQEMCIPGELQVLCLMMTMTIEKNAIAQIALENVMRISCPAEKLHISVVHVIPFQVKEKK